MHTTGKLDRRTLSIIASPTGFHVKQGLAAAEFSGFTAIEKPVSTSPQVAATLRSVCESVGLIDHQLHKPEMMLLIRDSRRGLVPWHDVSEIDFQLMETSSTHSRQLDHCVYDLAYHGLACALVSIRTALFEVSIQIDRASQAVYTDGPDQPKQMTAAMIQGQFVTPKRAIPFRISVGKGLAEAKKGLTLCGRSGEVMRHVRLSESGYSAHLRILKRLLGPSPQSASLIGLEDSIQVVNACAEALQVATTKPQYKFGTTPTWLQSRRLVLA